MEKVRIVVSVIVSLFVATVIRKTVLAHTLDKFYTTDTSSWGWATVTLWELIPTMIIAVLIFASVNAIFNRF